MESNFSLLIKDPIIRANYHKVRNQDITLICKLALSLRVIYTVISFLQNLITERPWTNV